MRLINLDGRVALLTADGAVDLHEATHGQFGPDPQEVFTHWEDLLTWANDPALRLAQWVPVAIDPERLRAPVPAPRQVFAVGLNYQAHADESGFVKPSEPVVFTKYASSLAGPQTTVALPSAWVDWEVELVVVVGRGGRNIPASAGWARMAGVCVGQDLSERRRQHAGPAPQFSLAKSFEGFSPTGPALVTIDELPDPDRLEISATIDGKTVQHAWTSDMIFPVPELIERLSTVVELFPGDLIFTGTPAGVGAGASPPRYLQPGNVLRSRIADVGELTQTFTDGGFTDAAEAQDGNAARTPKHALTAAQGG